MERALAGDVQLLILLLKRFRPHLYRDRVVVIHASPPDLAERLEAAHKRLLEMRRNEDSTGDAGERPM